MCDKWNTNVCDKWNTKLKKDPLMAKNSNKEQHISVRVTNVIHSQLTIYAKANNLTLSKAVEELLEEGLKSKNEPPAKKSDIDRLITETKRLQEQEELAYTAIIHAIQNQPVAVQQLEQPKQRKFLKFLKPKKD